MTYERITKDHQTFVHRTTPDAAPSPRLVGISKCSPNGRSAPWRAKFGPTRHANFTWAGNSERGRGRGRALIRKAVGGVRLSNAIHQMKLTGSKHLRYSDSVNTWPNFHTTQ